MTMLFLAIPVSHYCERARWALDLTGLQYSEEHYLPMFNRRRSRSLGGSGTLPVLIDGSTVLTDSAEIVSFAAARGGFTGNEDLAEADATLEHELAGAFGVATRRVAYAHFLGRRDLLLRYSAGLAPRWQTLALRIGYPVIVGKARKVLGIHDAAVAAAQQLIFDTLDVVAGRLEDGRSFLAGEQFSSLDITFASLLAPIIVPDNYGIELPALSELPADYRALAEQCRQHPAGAFAMKLYQGRPPSPVRAKIPV